MRVDADELRLKMAALDTDTLRRIAAASGDEYTPEARDAARVALSSRSTQVDRGSVTPPEHPDWIDSVPPRIRGMLPVYTVIAIGATVLIVLTFIAWYTDVDPGLAFTIQICLTAGVAWAIAIGIREEYAYVRVSIVATYIALAAATVIHGVFQHEWDGLIFAVLILWLASGLWRDPEVTRYYERLRS